MSEFDLTPGDVEHFASGVMPHERPTSVDAYRERLRQRFQELGIAHNMALEYNTAISDVLEVLDEEHA